MLSRTPMNTVRKAGPYSSLRSFFEFHLNPFQYFEIDGSEFTTIVGKRGTHFSFYPDTFSDVFGNKVKGKIRIKLRELFTKSDMILHAMPSTSRDRLMESGGCFYLQATKDDIPLRVENSISVRMAVNKKVSNPLALKVFTGSESDSCTLDNFRQFDWKPSQYSRLRFTRTTVRNVFYLKLYDLRWVNAAYIYGKKQPKTMLTADLPEDLEGLSDASAFVIYRDINAVARFYADKDKFTLFNVIKDQPADVIFLGILNGELAFGRKRLKKINGQRFTINIRKIEERDLVNTLNLY